MLIYFMYIYLTLRFSCFLVVLTYCIQHSRGKTLNYINYTYCERSKWLVVYTLNETTKSISEDLRCQVSIFNTYFPQRIFRSAINVQFYYWSILKLCIWACWIMMLGQQLQNTVQRLLNVCQSLHATQFLARGFKRWNL